MIGAGAAGLVTSYIASAVKAKVSLIEANEMGGDCLNTGCVPIDTCVRVIRLLTDDPVFAESEASRGVLADKLIEARARAILKSVAGNLALGGAVDVAVAGGRVVLSGAAAQGETIAELVGRIRAIDGVKDVDNQVRSVSPSYGV